MIFTEGGYKNPNILKYNSEICTKHIDHCFSTKYKSKIYNILSVGRKGCSPSSTETCGKSILDLSKGKVKKFDNKIIL